MQIKLIDSQERQKEIFLLIQVADTFLNLGIDGLGSSLSLRLLSSQHDFYFVVQATPFQSWSHF